MSFTISMEWRTVTIGGAPIDRQFTGKLPICDAIYVSYNKSSD